MKGFSATELNLGFVGRGEPSGSGKVAVDGLDWLDGGFKLESAFLVLTPFFSSGYIVDDCLAAVGFAGSGSRWDFVGGSEMSALVAVEWSKMICVGREEVGKMAACRFSIAPAGGLLFTFPARVDFVSGGSRWVISGALKAII